MDKCRICLEFKKNLCSVFEEDHHVSYAYMLTSIAKVKIVEGACNNSICLRCRRKLRSLYNFKKEIERSDLQLNQHLKILNFDNIGEVKAQLRNDIIDSKKHILTGIDDYLPILENGCRSVFYKNTTITRIKHETIPTLDLELIDNENDYYVDLYDDFVTSDYKPTREKKFKHKKRKVKDKEAKQAMKISWNMKKVCIMPTVLDNIRRMPLRRKPSKMANNKNRKRLDMCPHCGIMSSNIKSYIMVHIGEKKHVCIECNKAFFTSQSLFYHQKYQHLSAGAFKCDHCVAVFNNKGALRSHMTSHSDDRTHLCSICSKGFKRKSSLARHMLIHNSSAKSVKCELCNMSFFYKQGLRHHMRVHTGERPFKCEICSQPYSYKHDFNRHCLKKHGIFLKQRTVHVMNEEVLMQERALMKDLMLKVQGVVKEGEPLNPFKGPYAALAFGEAVKALGSCKIPIE